MELSVRNACTAGVCSRRHNVPQVLACSQTLGRGLARAGSLGPVISGGGHGCNGGVQALPPSCPRRLSDQEGEDGEMKKRKRKRKWSKVCRGGGERVSSGIEMLGCGLRVRAWEKPPSPQPCCPSFPLRRMAASGPTGGGVGQNCSEATNSCCSLVGGFC